MSDDNQGGDNGDGGAAPAYPPVQMQLSEAEQQALRQEAFNAAVHDTASALKSFFPSVPDEKILLAAGNAVAQQFSGGMDQILTDAAHPTDEFPRWGVRIDGVVSHAQAVIDKDPLACKDVHAMTGWLTIFALAMCPQARAAAALLGLKINFLHVRGQSKIIMPR